MSEDNFEDMLEYDTESKVKSYLAKLPSTLTQAIRLEPSEILDATASLHKVHSYWATQVAVAKGAQMAAIAAKEIGFARLREQHRHRMYQTLHSRHVTVDRATDRAHGDVIYAALCDAEVSATVEYYRLRAIVDAIITKREALRQLYNTIVSSPLRTASASFTHSQYDYDESVNQSLRECSDLVRRSDGLFRKEGKKYKEGKKRKEGGKEPT